jgi:alginate O-acetyltransferase complex protein AlgJ
MGDRMSNVVRGMTRRAGLAGALAAPWVPMQAQAQQPTLVEIGTQGWLFPVWDRVARIDMQALRSALQTVGEAIGILRAARIQVAICLIPSRKRLMRQFLPAGTQVSPEAVQRYSLTVAEATRAGALVPDLDAAFRAQMQRDPAHPMFFKTDTHWTPMGAELAAVEMARQMRAQMQLPASQRPGTRLGDLRPMVLAAGDLTHHVAAAQRGNFGAEQSLIRAILPAEGPAALLEDDSYDTIVVGTSNVQPRFGFQPVLSNQLVRPVGLSWRPNNVGTYFALLEYLRSDSFKRQRPRVLVWNHLEQDMVNATNNSAWGTGAMAPAEFINQLRRALA